MTIFWLGWASCWGCRQSPGKQREAGYCKPENNRAQC